MNPLTLEWLDKAAADLATARRELRARTEPNYDAVCFHSQQCAEKNLKAYLQEHTIAIPKTHKLLELLPLCLRLDHSIMILQPDLQRQEGYSVIYRYPGQSAGKSEARIAFQAATAVNDFITNKLG
jgi:HEPN domain-containing protein